jgi:hypothetical protein
VKAEQPVHAVREVAAKYAGLEVLALSGSRRYAVELAGVDLFD